MTAFGNFYVEWFNSIGGLYSPRGNALLKPRTQDTIEGCVGNSRAQVVNLRISCCAANQFETNRARKVLQPHVRLKKKVIG